MSCVVPNGAAPTASMTRRAYREHDEKGRAKIAPPDQTAVDDLVRARQLPGHKCEKGRDGHHHADRDEG